MPKDKKAAYAAKEQASADAATGRKLAPLTENTPMAKSAKKVIGRKQSRGK